MTRAGGAPSPAGAWWIKCDPTHPRHGGWDWPDLFRDFVDGEPYTWSVGTALSQKNARAARRGDPVFGYTAGEGHRHLQALAEVVRGAVFVPGEGPMVRRGSLPGGFTVDLRPVALLERPVPLARVRAALRGTDPEFFRTRFGSIFRVRPAEFRRLVRAIERENGLIELPAHWNALSAGRRRNRNG